MSKKKKSAAGRLFYTFGTIFFAAFFVVCAMNFTKDARIFQEPLLSASTVNTATQSEATENKTLKYKKSTTASSEKSKSTANKTTKANQTSKTNVTPKPTPDP